MMKTNRIFPRYAALVLAILTILSSLMLSACNTNTSDYKETTPPTDDTTPGDTTPDGTTAPEPEGITISGVPISEFKIVYYDSDYAKSCAQKLQSAISTLTDEILNMRRHSAKETEYEILIGKTDRDASNNIRKNYDRPNVYYDVVTDGTKLVIMGEGYTVLNKATDLFIEFLENKENKNVNITGKVASGNIIDDIDTEEVSMVNRANGTDVRVFHWNMTAPYHDPNVTTPPVVYETNKTRGEVMADIILQLLPDIITTNEFYKSHNGNYDLYNAVMGELGEYYVCLESPYDKNKPAVGADAIPNKTINCNILYRKDSGLSVVSSAWRYSTEKTTVTSANPGGWVYYHGSHTAIFSLNGNKFIVSTAHYADSIKSNVWAKEHLAAVADAQATSGISERLPVILTGDMYTSYSTSTSTGYGYIASQGYKDAQRTAAVNANNNITHGTFHTIGQRQTTRISEDFVWYTPQLEALCFKVLTSKDLDDTSDHYPVMADIKFK